MKREKLKADIQKIIDQVPDKMLEDIYKILKDFADKDLDSIKLSQNLNKILTEDTDLFERLAK